MSYDCCRVSIECLENGYTVEVPDMDAIAKKQKDAKKDPNATGEMYVGGMTKTFAAKDSKAVIKIVQAYLEKMPDMEYDTAFEDAAKT